MENKINTCCPYCGSDDICADVDIRITGKLQKDGTIRANDWWLQRSTLEDEAIGGTSSEDINGFCSNCGAYCAFDWEKGYIPYPKNLDKNEPTDIQKKYSLPRSRMTTILSNIIDHVAVANNTSGLIEELAQMGFEPQDLKEFGFSETELEENKSAWDFKEEN